MALQRGSGAVVPAGAAEAEARAVPGPVNGTELAGSSIADPEDEASMGEVIHVAFGTEREWEQTHEKTVDGLVTIGSLFGDDAGLMRAKADCVYQILREIVEEVPSVQITTKLPENLSQEQLDALTRVIKEAALKGIEIAMTHSVQVLMGSIYDLCTSKLHAYRR
jgi:hypothetical protein